MKLSGANKYRITEKYPCVCTCVFEKDTRNVNQIEIYKMDEEKEGEEKNGGNRKPAYEPVRKKDKRK